MRQVICLWVCLGLVSGCALRPRFRDFTELPLAGDLKMRVVDPSTGAPMREVGIELGEAKDKQVQLSAEDGSFVLPAKRRYFDDNVIVVVNLPKGVTDYRLEPMPPEGAPTPPPLPPEQAPAPNPAQ